MNGRLKAGPSVQDLVLEVTFHQYDLSAYLGYSNIFPGATLPLSTASFTFSNMHFVFSFFFDLDFFFLVSIRDTDPMVVLLSATLDMFNYYQTYN